MVSLTSVVESAILQPDTAPPTNILWTADEPAITNKALSGLSGDTLSFDSEELDNGRPYGFEFVRTGADFHNFFVKKSQ